MPAITGHSAAWWRLIKSSRRDPFPPVDGFAVAVHPIEGVSDNLDIPSTAGRPTEFPELAGSTVIGVDRLVDGVGVQFGLTVTVDRGRNMVDELS